jgi:dynactin complex subunit
MEANQEKTDANLKEMKARLNSNQEEIKFSKEEMKEETKTGRLEMKATVSVIQEKMEAATSFIRSKLERALKHHRTDVLACVDPRTLGLRKELNKKFEETQVDLQAVKTSLDMRTKSQPVYRHFTGDMF